MSNESTLTFEEKATLMVRNVLQEYAYIVLNEEQIQSLINSNKEFFEEELSLGYEHPDDFCYLDTYPRETIIHMFAVEFLGCHWPMYGDSQEYKKSFKENLKQLDLRGIISIVGSID